MDRVSIGGLRPTRGMAEFIAQLLADTPQTPPAFWSGLAAIVRDLGPVNRALLAERDRLQSAIDKWHRDRRGRAIDLAAYEAFLRAIGYLLPEPAAVRAETSSVDEEIATIAGPQLVVPLTNARYALNAATFAVVQEVNREMDHRRRGELAQSSRRAGRNWPQPRPCPIRRPH